MDAAEYCREVEAYLCRKNEGHLVRIVGPAFEQVCGWFAAGVPLKITLRGIDQYCERYYSKPQRRPVRIEFCEADVLDLFDAWRRAVGAPAVSERDEGSESDAARRRPSLAGHIDRAIARLTSARAGARHSAEFDAAIAAAVRELDGLSAAARTARGARRDAAVARLAEVDRDLMAAAEREIDPDAAAALRRERDRELAPFAVRMAPEAHVRAAEAAYARLVREALGLPVITYE